MQIGLVGIESENAQYILLSQKLFEYFCFWNLRFCRSEIFPLNGFEYLVPMNRDIARRCNTDFYVAGADVEDCDFNFVANNRNPV